MPWTKMPGGGIRRRLLFPLNNNTHFVVPWRYVLSRILCISQSSYEIASLDKAELGGSNVEGIDIGSEAGKGLLGAVRAVGQKN